MTYRRLEIAIDSTDDGLAAIRSGVDRLELCTELGSHGFTADPAVLAALVAAARVPVLALVRPREPGFTPDATVFRSLLDDAQRLLAAGAAGIAFGLLMPEHRIDAERVREVVRACAGRTAVFHRAFDLVPDPTAAAAQLADLGVQRILTAGQTPEQATATLGLRPRPHADAQSEADLSARLGRIRTLVERASARIEILIGGSVRAHNAARIVRDTGCTQVHSSCRDRGRFDAAEAARLRAVLDG